MIPRVAFTQQTSIIHFEQVGKKIHIFYDLEGVEIYNVQVFCITDSGKNWSNPLQSVLGDVGENQHPGINKR